jgi:hypothetical protein
MLIRTWGANCNSGFVGGGGGECEAWSGGMRKNDEVLPYDAFLGCMWLDATGP